MAEIRKGEPADLDQLMEIENEQFSDHPWPKDEFEYELGGGNPYAVFYVYVINEEIVGFVDLWIMFEQAQIANIAVKKAYMNQGVGSSLMKKAVNESIRNECENLSLEVRESNDPAIHLYEKFGFMEVAVRRNYYENGENALLMVKPLGGLEYDDDYGD